MKSTFANLKIEFNPQLFNEAINKYGVRATWERAMMCWCYSDHSGSPDPNCVRCKGTGTLYVNSKEIRVLAYNMTSDFEHEEIGERMNGSCTITIKPEDAVGYRDKLTFMDFLSSYSEFVSSEDNPDFELKYPVENMVSLQHPEGELKLGTDYFLSEDKKHIIWSECVVIPNRFSVLYTIRPVYIVVDILKELRGNFIKDGLAKEKFVMLPRQFLIRKDFFV